MPPRPLQRSLALRTATEPRHHAQTLTALPTKIRRKTTDRQNGESACNFFLKRSLNNFRSPTQLRSGPQIALAAATSDRDAALAGLEIAGMRGRYGAVLNGHAHAALRFPGGVTLPLTA